MPGVCKNEADMGISESCAIGNTCANATCTVVGTEVTFRNYVPLPNGTSPISSGCFDNVSERIELLEMITKHIGRTQLLLPPTLNVAFRSFEP